MRSLIAGFCFVLLLVGCAAPKTVSTGATPPAAAKIKPGQATVTPDFRPTGKIAMYNADGRFVVMTFPVGTLPQRESTLGVYRDGLKVGEVKVTGFSRDVNVVGDVVAGSAQVNDEVKEN